MRKTVFCICENKDAYQLRSDCLNPKFQDSSHLLWFMSDLVGNHEDRFSRDKAHNIAGWWISSAGYTIVSSGVYSGVEFSDGTDLSLWYQPVYRSEGIARGGDYWCGYC